MDKNKDTSWDKVGSWYSKITEGGGHYYHSQVVLPGVKRLLAMDEQSSLLDLACGSGVLAAHIPTQATYVGVDKAKSLIEEAKRRDRNPKHKYLITDATKPFALDRKFSHAAIILAMQNMQVPEKAIANIANHMEKEGVIVIVLNHPAFRIPRQSSWGIDEGNKLQYRRVNRYFSPLEVPIKAHPGQGQSPITWSYHLPISAYSKMLTENGFVITALEEWASPKESYGKAAKMENRARAEFPLFLTIKARYVL